MMKGLNYVIADLETVSLKIDKGFGGEGENSYTLHRGNVTGTFCMAFE